ncbi:helicase carboxy-terminal domain protein [Pelomyxa schiedti]|nr:helicase carboxy-terminal domain protein [Pelomyxa schiedti]
MSDVIAQFSELLELCKQNGGADLTNKKIVLLIGPSGAGKTLTAHFLAGHKIIQKEHVTTVNGRTTSTTVLDVVEQDERLTVGHGKRSQTRNTSSIAIPNTSLVVVDSGFDGTAGSLIDLANIVGLHDCLRTCRAVIPVLLIHYYSLLADRGKGVGDLIRLVMRLFKSPNWLNNILVFITNVQHHTLQDIIGHCHYVIEACMCEHKDPGIAEKAKDLFDFILNDLEAQQSGEEANRVLLLDPLDPSLSSRDDFVRVLTRASAIRNPSAVFNIVLTDEVQLQLQEMQGVLEQTFQGWVEQEPGRGLKVANRLLSLLQELDKYTGEYTGKMKASCRSMLMAKVTKMQKDSRYILEQMLKSQCVDEEGCMFILSYRDTLVLLEVSTVEHFTGIERVAEFDKWTMAVVGGYCTASIEEVVDPCLAKRELSQLAEKMLLVQNLGKSLANKEIYQLFESVSQRVIQKIVNAACITPSVEELLSQEAATVLESPSTHAAAGGVPLLEVSRNLLLLSEAEEKLFSLPHVNAVAELRVRTLTQLKGILAKSFEAVQTVPSDLTAFSLHFLTIKMLDLDVPAQHRKAVLFIKDYCLSFLEQVGQLTGNSEEIQGKELAWKVAQVKKLKDLDEGVARGVQEKFAVTMADLSRCLRDTQNILQDLLTKFPVDFPRVSDMIVQIKRTSWVDEYCSKCTEALLDNTYAHLKALAERTEKRIQDAWSVRLFAQVSVYFKQLAAMRVLGSVIPNFHEIEERCSVDVITRTKELCNLLSQGDLDFRKTRQGFLDMAEIEKLCASSDEVMIARTLTKECKEALSMQLVDKMGVMLQNLGLLDTPVSEKIEILKTCMWAISQSICTLDQVLIPLHTMFETIASRITSLDTPATEAQVLLKKAAEHSVLSIYIPEVRQLIEKCHTGLEGKLNESNKSLASALDSKQFDLVEGFLKAGPTQKKNISQVQAWVSMKMEELKQAVTWWLPLEQNAVVNAASIADLFKSLQMMCNSLQGTPESPREAAVIVDKFKSDFVNFQTIVNEVISTTIEQVRQLSKQGRVADVIEHVKVLKQVQLSLTVVNILQPPVITALRTLQSDFLDETKLLDEKIKEATQETFDCAKINLLFGTAGGAQVQQRVADVIKTKCSSIEGHPGAELELEDLVASLQTLKPELLRSVSVVLDKAKDRMRKNNENRERVVLSLFNEGDAEGVQRELLKLKKEWDKSVYDQLILDLTGSFNKLCVDRASLSPSLFEFLWKASSLIKDLPSSEFTKLCQEFMSNSLDIIKKIQKETEPIVTSEFTTVCLPIQAQQSQLTGLGLVLFILPYCTRQEGIFAVGPLREKASNMVRECTALMEAIKNQAEKLLNTFNWSLSCSSFMEVTTVLRDIKRLELGHKCLQPLAALLLLNHPTFPTFQQFCEKVKEQLTKMSAECDPKLEAHTPATFAEVEVIWKAEAQVHQMFKEVPETTVEFAIKQKVTKFFDGKSTTAQNLWSTNPKNYAAINELLVLFINGKSLCGTLNIGAPQQFMETVLEGVRAIQLPPSLDPDEVANMLCYIYKLAQDLPALGKGIQQVVTEKVKLFFKGLSGNIRVGLELGTCLMSHEGGVGWGIINENQEFQMARNKALSKLWSTHDIDYVLSHFMQQKSASKGLLSYLEGDAKAKLKADYEVFKAAYTAFIENKFFCDIKEEGERISSRSASKPIPQLIAELFGLWTLMDLAIMDSTQRTAVSDKTNLKQPHPAQVVAVLQLVTDPSLNQFLKLRTGEGKSITLGITAIVLALKGFQVDVISYSETLSERDGAAFSPLFVTLRVKDRIFYGTIRQLCERFINKSRPLRDRISQFLNQPELCQPIPAERSLKRALLIDEVDVFFSEDFLGKTYQPVALLQLPECLQLIQYVWKHHTDASFSLPTVKQQPCYTSLLQKFPYLQNLFENQVHQMLSDVHTFGLPPYHVSKEKQKIGYKEHGIATDINYQLYYPHRTSFAYIHEFEQGNLLQPTIEKNVAIPIPCGHFSYAEIPTPKHFDLIAGLSGTLMFTGAELQTLLNQFGVKLLSYVPSVFGESQQYFDPVRHVKIIVNYENYMLEIKNMAEKALLKNRAVLIFFETTTRMSGFIDWNSKSTNPLGGVAGCRVCFEDTVGRDEIIKNATNARQVTLFSRGFGRGVDFVCYDPVVNDNGGVLVIQAFLAETLAEEVQVKGRTARQAKKGSYSIVLWGEDISKRYHLPQAEVERLQADSTRYEQLATLRQRACRERMELLLRDQQDAEAQHNATMEFCSRLDKFSGSDKSKHRELTTRLAALMQSRLLPLPPPRSCFTIMCLDESGSMQGDPWISLKTAVDAFCTRRISQCAQACLPCEDRVWVIGYTDSAFHRIPSSLEAEPERLVSGLSSRLTHFAGGMTSFRAPLTALQQVLDGSGPNRRPIAGMTKVLLFITDGQCDDGDAEMQKLYNAYPDLKVFVVGFGTGCDTERLKRLAAQGRGSYFAGLDLVALMQVLDTVAAAISSPVMFEGNDYYAGQSCPMTYHFSREHPFRRIPFLDVQPKACSCVVSPLPGQITHGQTCFEGASLLSRDSTTAKASNMVMKIIFNWENTPQQTLLQPEHPECTILSLVPAHPNVIRHLGTLVIPCRSAEFVEKIPSDKMYFREQLCNYKSIAILMPHCGITFSFYSSSKNCMTVECARNLFFQGLRAICHIESHFVVHRDIKGDNILIDPETENLTLIDFGESQCCPNMEVHLSTTSQPWGNTGTMPPELSIFLKRITRGTGGVFSYSKCDSFALALTFWNALLPQSNRFIGSSMNLDMSTFNTQSLLSHFPVPLFLAESPSPRPATESPQPPTPPLQSVATLQRQRDSVLESVMIRMMNPDKAARLSAADAIHELTS